MHLVSADKDRSSVFKVKNVTVKVDSLKFSIRDSKHDFLYKVVKPLATGLVKKQIQKAFAGAITTGLEYVDGQLVGVRDRLAEAKVTEGDSRTKALQEVRATMSHTCSGIFPSHRYSLARRRKLLGSAVMKKARISRSSLIRGRAFSQTKATPPVGLIEPLSMMRKCRLAESGAPKREFNFTRTSCELLTLPMASFSIV